MKRFITRAYNNLSLDSLRGGVLTKTSSEKKLSDEINYFQAVENMFRQNGNTVGIYFPRCFERQALTAPYLLELEYLPLENLGSILIDQTYDEETWSSIVQALTHALLRFSTNECPPEQQNIRHSTGSDRRAMFVDKTLKEFGALIKNDFFAKLAKHPELIVNGTAYKNFPAIADEVCTLMEQRFCSDEPLTMIHGDMCFSNILCGLDRHKQATLKFVDPRGSFGSHFGVYGDPAYDLAKLKHSLNGKYELIIYDKFTLGLTPPDSNIISFSFQDHLAWKYDKVLALVEQYLIPPGKDDVLKVSLIEGLIYIGMCARHYDSLDRQKIMYATGVRILNEALATIKDDK